MSAIADHRHRPPLRARRGPPTHWRARRRSPRRRPHPPRRSRPVGRGCHATWLEHLVLFFPGQTPRPPRRTSRSAAASATPEIHPYIPKLDATTPRSWSSTPRTAARPTSGTPTSPSTRARRISRSCRCSVPGARRRHHVHQPVPGLRGAVRADARPPRRAHRGHHAMRFGHPEHHAAHPVVRVHPGRPAAARCTSTACSPRTSSQLKRDRERRAPGVPVPVVRAAAVPVPLPLDPRAPSRSGTTGDPALRGPTTTRAPHHRAGHGDRRPAGGRHAPLATVRAATRLPERLAGGVPAAWSPTRPAELDVELTATARAPPRSRRTTRQRAAGLLDDGHRLGDELLVGDRAALVVLEPHPQVAATLERERGKSDSKMSPPSTATDHGSGQSPSSSRYASSAASVGCRPNQNPPSASSRCRRSRGAPSSPGAACPPASRRGWRAGTPARTPRWWARARCGRTAATGARCRIRSSRTRTARRGSPNRGRWCRCAAETTPPAA